MYIMLHVNSFASSAGDCHPRYEPGDTRFQVKRHRISKCDNCGNVVPFAGKAHTYQLQWRANRFYILQWVSFSQSFNCLWILRISGFQVSPICQLVWMLTLGSFGPHGGNWAKHKAFIQTYEERLMCCKCSGIYIYIANERVCKQFGLMVFWSSTLLLLTRFRTWNWIYKVLKQWFDTWVETFPRFYIVNKHTKDTFNPITCPDHNPYLYIYICWSSGENSAMLTLTVVGFKIHEHSPDATHQNSFGINDRFVAFFPRSPISYCSTVVGGNEIFSSLGGPQCGKGGNCQPPTCF